MLLDRLGVCFPLTSIAESEKMALINAKCLDIPDPNTLTGILQKQGKLRVLQNFPNPTDSLASEMLNIIAGYRGNLPTVFLSLPILKCEGGKFSAINQSILIQRGHIPKKWNPNFANLVSLESIDYAVQKKLNGIPKWSHDDICQLMFSRIDSLSREEQVSFSRYVLEWIQSSWLPSRKLISLAQQYCKVLDLSLIHI